MKCPKCSLEAMITRTRMEADGDKSPDTQTEVWVVQVYQCRNPVCGAFETDVGETHHRVFPEENDRKGGEESE